MDYSGFSAAEDAAIIKEWKAWCCREGVTAPDSNNAWQWGMMWSAFLDGWTSGKKYNNDAHNDADH